MVDSCVGQGDAAIIIALALLLHIGYHKTGTTWLQEGLLKAAEVGFSSPWSSMAIAHGLILPNELDFDAEAAVAEFQPGVRAAEQAGLVPVLSWERLSGSPHAGGFDSAIIARRLQAVFPGGRVLIGVREQRSMIFALYQQYVRDGGVATLNGYLRPRNPAEIPQFRFEHLEYDRLVALYRDLFGAERVLVLPVEHLSTDHQRFAEAIAAHAGAGGPVTGLTPVAANVGISPFTVALKRQANRWFVRNSLSPGARYYVKDHDARFRRLDRRLPARLGPASRQGVEGGDRVAGREPLRGEQPATPGTHGGLFPVGSGVRHPGRGGRVTALSIVIPCLDVAGVLGRQLDALVREQADFDWEVVVVDNGSSDGSEAVAMSYEDRLPALRIVQEPERGRHHACNAGAAAAHAPKLAFIDADDVIESGYVMAMARALDEHDVVAGRLVNLTADGAPLSGFGQMQVDGLEPSFGFLPFAAGPNFGILKDVFADVGGFTADVPFGEDVDLSWRLTLAGHAIGFEPEAVVRYHQRAGLAAMFRQHRRFGAAHAYLYAKYRGAGMPRRRLRVVAQDWWRCVIAVPFLRDDQVRARFVRRLARNIGRVEGSVRARTFYP